MSMFNTGDILETIEMFTQDNLDVRTVTMGISLLDCIDPDPKKACENIYNKITTKAANLVSTVEHISAEYGIPIINKRVAVTPISIAAAVRQHFCDIGHDESVTDVTYENAQARERTQILMDIANQQNGIVVGTGDLSELALGWATYNGDHMSMYGVNAGVPKTLVRHLVRYEADIAATPALKEVLLDILDTPVSPELLPAKDNGEIAQRTEDLVGPYELHDFYLYYVLRFGFGPAKIFRLARAAFAGREEYPDAVLYKWLRNFYWRFFAQQFKRSCLPDGPKIGSVTLSPRGDWRMPSDACAALWLAELEQLFPQKDA